MQNPKERIPQLNYEVIFKRQIAQCVHILLPSQRQESNWLNTSSSLLKHATRVTGTEGFGRTLPRPATETEKKTAAESKHGNQQPPERNQRCRCPWALLILYFYPLLPGRWSAAWLSCSSPRGPWGAVWNCGWALKNRGCCCSFSTVGLEVSLQYPDYRTSSAALTASCKGRTESTSVRCGCQGWRPGEEKGQEKLLRE